MSNTDMIIFTASGDGSIVDAYSTEYGAPLADDTDNMEDISIVNENGVYTFTAYRKLDTGDSQDYVMTLDQEMPFMWSE